MFTVSENEQGLALCLTLLTLCKSVWERALEPGAVVTTTRAYVHYIITEYGTAMLRGLSLAERARSLISIAAPQFREQLERAAYDLHLFS